MIFRSSIPNNPKLVIVNPDGLDTRCRPAAGHRNEQFDRKREFCLGEFIKKQISNVEVMYSIHILKDGAQRHPQIFNLQSSIFNYGLPGLGLI